MLGFLMGFQNIAFSQNNLIPKRKDSILNKKKEKRFRKNFKHIAFDGNDGPYIIDGILYSVSEKNTFLKTSEFNRDSILVKVDNKDKDEFYVSLFSDYKVPETIYEQPKKLITISDIEGNFNAFSSFLKANEIIDDNHNWIYDDGHLVLNGDFVDRGNNVTQILWLIYKLEQQAKKQDGHVHFILGNHEILNFYGDHRYNRGKYIQVAQEISKKHDKTEALRYLYSKKSELGQWLSTKNVIEKIGDYLFAHAGLSPEVLEHDFKLEDINEMTRDQYYGFEKTKDKKPEFLFGSKGPFWYRGFVMKRSNYNKIKPEELDKILNHFEAKKIVIGHTPVKQITATFNGKVINVDVHHGTEKSSGKTFGLLIKDNQEFIIDDTEKKTILQVRY